MTQLILTGCGLALMALPLIDPVRGRLLRLLRKAWPKSRIRQRSDTFTIADAAAILIPAMLLSGLTAPHPVPLTWGLGTVLVALALFDLRVRQLPDRLTYPLAAAGLVVTALQTGSPWWALAGLVGAGGTVWLIAEAYYHLRGGTHGDRRRCCGSPRG
jgi:prepilin signal peptidase PulO-like enzyme (type II secretory pathway)